MRRIATTTTCVDGRRRRRAAAIVPGTDATRHLVNASILEALGPDGILVNVGRGSVVDEGALVSALKDGTIRAAGLDVFADEPNVSPELVALTNAVLLPHVGSASVHTRNAMGQLVVDNLKSWFRDGKPLTPVPDTADERRATTPSKRRHKARYDGWALWHHSFGTGTSLTGVMVWSPLETGPEELLDRVHVVCLDDEEERVLAVGAVTPISLRPGTSSCRASSIRLRRVGGFWSVHLGNVK